MIWSKQEAATIAAFEYALPAIHLPGFFGQNFSGSAIDVLLQLQRLQGRKRVPWKLLVNIGKRAKMPHTATEEQRKIGEESGCIAQDLFQTSNAERRQFRFGNMPCSAPAAFDAGQRRNPARQHCHSLR